MADVDFDNFEGGYAAATPGRSAHLVNLAGAACSVGLVIGLAIWGYNLAVRDVTGVPVMRAISGPMRVAHDNPGGDIASHQGLSVNAVAAAGTAAPLPEQLVLAPRPVDLSFEDTAGLTVSPDSELAVIAPEIALDGGALDGASLDGGALEGGALAGGALDVAALDVAALAAPPAAAVDTAAVALALAAALAEGAEPLAALTEEAALAGSGMTSSPRPLARPGNRNASAEAVPTDVQSVAAVAATEIDPATLAVGTRLVQLGAFDDVAGAKAEWTRLAGTFGDLMAGKAVVVQAAQSGGRTFYRLRAHGFDNEDDARRFCSALLAENAACIPVAHR